MRIVGKTIWKFNAYVWALALAFWGYFAYLGATYHPGNILGPIALVSALLSAVVVAISIWKVNQ